MPDRLVNALLDERLEVRFLLRKRESTTLDSGLAQLHSDIAVLIST